jgi:hypothetical protein
MLVVGPAAGDAPLLSFLHDDRTAVIEHRSLQINGRLVLHQIRVHRVTTREHAARHHHDVADLQRSDDGVAQRRFERD